MVVPARNRRQRPEFFPEVIVPGSREALEFERIFAAEKERKLQQQLAKEFVRSFPAYASVFACADFHNRQKADMLSPALAVAPFLFVGIVVPLMSLLVLRSRLQWFEQRALEAFHGAGSDFQGYAAVLTLMNVLSTIAECVVCIPFSPLFDAKMIVVLAFAGVFVVPAIMYYCIPRGPLRVVWELSIIARVCVAVYCMLSIPIDRGASLHEAAPLLSTDASLLLFLLIRGKYLLRHRPRLVPELSFSSPSGSESESNVVCVTGSQSDGTRVPSLSSESESTPSADNSPEPGMAGGSPASSGSEPAPLVEAPPILEGTGAKTAAEAVDLSDLGSSSSDSSFLDILETVDLPDAPEAEMALTSSLSFSVNHFLMNKQIYTIHETGESQGSESTSAAVELGSVVGSPAL